MESVNSSRGRGRSARKRLQKRTAENSAAHDAADSCSVTPLNGEEFRRRLNELPPDEAAALARSLLSEVQQIALSEYTRQLRLKSSNLSEEGAWLFLATHLQEARRLGLESILREMVFDHAGHFANSRMLRLTARYRPR